MGELKIGDIVGRKSYGADILFKVVDKVMIGSKCDVILKGITYRIQADAPEDDLILVPKEKIDNHKEKDSKEIEKNTRNILEMRSRGQSPKGFFRSTSNENPERFSIPGNILHIDGDGDYLNNCLKEYEKLGLIANGYEIAEKDQARQIRKLLEENRPDILILTGHDGVIKDSGGYADVNSYRNSKYYIEAVKEARKFDPSMDNLVIFAGACQSYYEGILAAGANFASAPYRVLIHALDPVFICEKIAFSSFEKVVSPKEVVDRTITGVKGIGGIATRGKAREGYPKPPVYEK